MILNSRFVMIILFFFLIPKWLFKVPWCGGMATQRNYIFHFASRYGGAEDKYKPSLLKRETHMIPVSLCITCTANMETQNKSILCC